MSLSCAGQARTNTDVVGRGGAQVWRRDDKRRCWLAVPCFWAVVAAAGSAAGVEAPAAGDGGPTASLELRTIGGGAAIELTMSNAPVVKLDAAAFGVGARVGGFLGPHLQLGATASIVRYVQIGQLDVRDAETFADEYWLREPSYTVVSPFGAFAELYPLPDGGFFFGVSLCLGYIPANLPSGGNYVLMAGYAIEVGYESPRSEQHGLGVFLRFAGWDGTESPLYTDFPEGVGSRELTLGVRWTFRP